MSRIVLHMTMVDCDRELQFALSADGGIWQWEWSSNICGNDAIWAGILGPPAITVVFSVVAWLTVVIGDLWRTSKSPPSPESPTASHLG